MGARLRMGARGGPLFQAGQVAAGGGQAEGPQAGFKVSSPRKSAKHSTQAILLLW